MFGQTTDTLPSISKRFYIVTLILVVTGFCVTLIGTAMPFWSAVKDVTHGGVFQICDWSFKDCAATNKLSVKYKDADVYKLLWGLTITGLVMLLVAMVFLFLYPLQKTVNYCKIALGIFTSIFLITGVVLILAALIVYVDFGVWLGRKLSDVFEDISWTWYLTLFGLIILVTGFICLVLHMFFMAYGNEVAPVQTYRGGYSPKKESPKDYYVRRNY